MKISAVVIALLMSIVTPLAVKAQPGPLIIDQNRPDRSAPQVFRPHQRPLPVGAGRVEAAQAASTLSFVLKGVDIQGSSLPPEALTPAYAPYIGRKVTLTELSALADAVGAAYAKSNVALYTVLLPRQGFENGRVRLRVVEGFVSDVEITPAAQVRTAGLMQRFAERLRGRKPLTRKELDRQLSLMRDVPGSKVDVQLLQGAEPGAVQMVLTPTLKRFETGLSINNRGSAYLGRTQVQAQLTGNSLLRPGDQTVLTVAFPTDVQRFQYVAVSHSEPIGATGATASVNVGYLRTKPDIAGFDLSGTAKTAGLQLIYPLLRGSKENLYLVGGLDGLNSDNALFGRRFSSEHTRALRASATYSRQTATRALTATVSTSFGLDALGARVADPRYAKADFRKMNVQAGANQAFGSRWVVRLAAGGQLGMDRLPASEQFSIGGSQFGRAFAASEAIGDSGYGGSAELAYRPTGKIPKALAGSEVYGFIDGAVAVSRGRYGLGDRRMDLSSTGAGVRIAVATKGVLELEAGKALDAVDLVSKDKPWRLMVNFRSVF